MNLRCTDTRPWKGPALCFAGVLFLAAAQAGCAHAPAPAHAGGAQEEGLALSLVDMPDQLQAGEEAFVWVELKNLRKEKLFFSDTRGVNPVVDYADGSGYGGPIVAGPHECRDRFQNKHLLLPGQSYYVAHEFVPKRAGKASLRLTLSLEFLDDDGTCSGTTLQLETRQHPIVIQ